jgi:hypothetical protein
MQRSGSKCSQEAELFFQSLFGRERNGKSLIPEENKKSERKGQEVYKRDMRSGRQLFPASGCCTFSMMRRRTMIMNV